MNSSSAGIFGSQVRHIRFKRIVSVVMMSIMAAAISESAQAEGMLRERLKERMQQHSGGKPGTEASAGTGTQDGAELGGGGDALTCEQWARKVNRLQKRGNGKNEGPTPDLKDVAYGRGDLERLDVFLPKQAGRNALAPIIMMVHGGGWCVGDKGGATMTENKVARWVSKGFLFISVNYPMVSQGSDAIAQANHVAKAAAFVQANAQKWGGNPTQLIMMGHSAGAHLVSLVNADARIRQASGMRPALGTVSLDAGAIDVVRQMPNVYPFLKTRYREAFGDTETQWIAASPFHQFDATAAPWLGVCSTTRKDDPCGQARAYAEKSNGLGVKASVLPQRKSHGAINAELGLPGTYTSDVEAFMASLDRTVASALSD